MTDEQVEMVLQALFAKHNTVIVTPALKAQWANTVLSGVDFSSAMIVAKKLARDMVTPAAAIDFDRAMRRLRGEAPVQIDKETGRKAIAAMREQYGFLNNERKAVGQ